MIKLIASDLDGTLLNKEHQLSKRTAAVIKKLQEAGYRFLAATGRTYESSAPLFERHGICCEYLLLNGALLCDSRKTVYRSIVMDAELVKKIFTYLCQREMAFHMYTAKGTAVTDKEKATEAFLAHARKSGMSEEKIEAMLKEDGFGRYDMEIRDVDELLQQQIPVYKIEVYGEDPLELEDVRVYFEQYEELAIANSFENNIELTMKQAQKGYTLQAYCQMHGIAEDEVLVLGDSLNDVCMLQLFSNSIAMKNGGKEAKASARYHSLLTNEEEGAAVILEHLLIGGTSSMKQVCSVNKKERVEG